MNGSTFVFSKAGYMNGVRFEIMARTAIPQFIPSPPPPLHPEVPDQHELPHSRIRYFAVPLRNHYITRTTVFTENIRTPLLLIILVLKFEQSHFTMYNLFMYQNCWMRSKQWRPWSVAAICGVWLRSTLDSSGLSVPKLKIITVCRQTARPSDYVDAQNRCAVGLIFDCLMCVLWA